MATPKPPVISPKMIKSGAKAADRRAALAKASGSGRPKTVTRAVAMKAPSPKTLIHKYDSARGAAAAAASAKPKKVGGNVRKAS